MQAHGHMPGSSRFIQVHPGSSRFQAHLCIAVVLYTPKLFCIFTAKEREIYIYIYLFSYIHIYTALQVVVSPLTHRTFTSKFLLLSFQGPNARLVPHNLLTRIPRGLLGLFQAMAEARFVGMLDYLAALKRKQADSRPSKDGRFVPGLRSGHRKCSAHFHGSWDITVEDTGKRRSPREVARRLNEPGAEKGASRHWRAVVEKEGAKDPALREPSKLLLAE